MKWLMYYLIVVNLLTWIIYGIDKWKAKRRAWRIPERTLLLLAAAGGCTGALAGMLMFRHKTRKLKFMIGVPVIFVVESIFFAYIFFSLNFRCIFSAILSVSKSSLIAGLKNFSTILLTSLNCDAMASLVSTILLNHK